MPSSTAAAASNQSSNVCATCGQRKKVPTERERAEKELAKKAAELILQKLKIMVNDQREYFIIEIEDKVSDLMQLIKSEPNDIKTFLESARLRKKPINAEQTIFWKNLSMINGFLVRGLGIRIQKIENNNRFYNIRKVSKK